MSSSTPSIETQSETLNGVLERIIYYNEETHFCIGELRPRGLSHAHVILGSLPGVQCGETLKLGGQWVHHPQHGQQFKFNEFESRLPATVHGIRKYLSSGLIDGIGATYANKIVDHFKTDTLKVISEESARLLEIPGIGPQRAKSIKKAWDSQQAVREIFLFLKTYGVSTSKCIRLVKVYGNSAADILRNDPYRLARDLDGIGFKTADKIAINLGLPNDSPQRIQAGLLHAMMEFLQEGHTASARQTLLEKAHELLESDIEKINEHIDELVKNEELTELEPPECLLQLPRYCRYEGAIACSLAILNEAQGELPPLDTEKALVWAQERAGFEFATEQKAAIKTALESKISILTGGPGTGKTTILRALVEILHAKKVRVLLAAPTGRAAQRMSQAARATAQTIHRLLKYDPEIRDFTYSEERPLPCDFLIIDESSMLDTKLAEALLKAVPQNGHLLLVGDIHQLPSVGPGAILADLISSGKYPTTQLNTIFRQHNHSRIVTTAHAILEGQTGCPGLIETPGEIARNRDLHFIRASTPEEAMSALVELTTKTLPNFLKFNPLTDAQILAPMHKGMVGIENLNNQLQEILNSNKLHLTYGSKKFKLGDKVIQTRNNYDKFIFNGDLGIIEHINKENKILTVNFDGNTVELEQSEFGDLTLAYAISIHKSQGSEFPVAIIPLLKQHFVMLKRNLIYTAITRARRHVILVGDPAAYALAVSNQDSAKRCTDLLPKIHNA